MNLDGQSALQTRRFVQRNRQRRKGIVATHKPPSCRAVITAEPAPIAFAASTHCDALIAVGLNALGGPEPALALAVPELCSQPVKVQMSK